MRRTTRLTFFLATLACSWAAAQNLVTNQALQLTNGTYGTPAKVPLEAYAERNGAERLDKPMLQPLTSVAVSVTPVSVSLSPGQKQQFTAVVTGTLNTAVTWSVKGMIAGNSPVGTVTNTGLYTGPASLPGTLSLKVTVTAKSVQDPTKSAAASVTITQSVAPPVTVTVSLGTVTLGVGQTQQFSATVTGTTNTAVTWSVSPAVGSVSSGGLYTAPATLGSPQTITVTATSVANTSKTAAASVTIVPPIQVTVSPSTASLTPSQTQQFSAVVSGTTNTAVTWSVSPAVGTVSSGGLYTAPATLGSPQTVTVTATSVADTSKTATASVTIVPPIQVKVSPSTASLAPSQTQQFTAAVSGTANTAVTWSVNPAVGTITGGGLYTAPASLGSLHSVTVTATSVQDPTKSATASVTITSLATPPVTVTVSPGTATLGVGQTQQFSATVTGTTNMAATGTTKTAVTWSVSPAVGTISSGGLYTAPATLGSPQTVTVTATSVADTSKTATVSVTIVPPIQVTASPSTASLAPSQTQQFTATVTGTTNTAVTWSVSPAVGTITSGGLYRAPATLSRPQTVSVTATSVADTSKTATVSVTITPPVTVSVTPTAATMLPSQGQTFTATVGGTTNTGVTWSIAPATGTISSSGLYAAPPTISSTSSVMVTAASVADATKSASATVTLIPPVQITTSSLPGGTVGTAYNATLAATGGVTPYTWSVVSGQLPLGLSLSASSGMISGTPATAGAYNVTMQVTDAAGYQATTVLAIAIVACTTCSGPISITTTSLPAGTVGVPYNSTLMATGGKAPYTWSTASGQLPTGLRLDPAAGTISGTPSAAGAYNFAAMVTDSASPQKTASQPLPINVTGAPATDAYGGLMTFKSPGGITGKWGVEKYPTADGNGRWLFTTPDGHGLWCGSQFAITKPTSLNVMAKYGSQLNWEKAALDRYTGWGFNCMGEYVDLGLVTDMNASLLNERIPYFNSTAGDHYVMDAIGRRSMLTGQALPTDAVKNLAYTTQLGSWTADGFDPNLAAYIGQYAKTRAGNTRDTYTQELLNAYNISIAIDDSDFTQGFGPGPDDCATPDGTYHSHVGWMALASPLNLYAQWLNEQSLYDSTNWVFVNPEVYAKNNLVSYLQTEYGTISALNTAWGSSYAAFNTAATRYTGESVGSTNGVLTTLTHTLAHSSGVSAGSLLIKVDGAPMITDPPHQSGRIYGRWPDGATSINGSINYSNGSLTISGESYQPALNITPPGTTSWGDVKLGKTNIVTGTVIMRLEPPDCRLNTTDIASDGYNCLSNGGPYTITGSLNYSTGVITGLSISPAIPRNQQVQFQFYWRVPLPGSHTLTVDYDVNGWGVGTTLADEDGSHTAWLGGKGGFLPKPGNAAGMTPTASTTVWTDLNAWLYNYSEAFFTSTIDTIRPYFPGKLITAQFSGLGGHQGCPRKEMVLAAANHSDFLPFSQVTPRLLNLLVTWGLGDYPIMDAWEGLTANRDSAFSADGLGDALSTQQFVNQALRGAAMATDINTALTGRGSGGRSHQMLGIKFWAYSDTTGEGTNYGLVSPSDNAYDGAEATSGTHACSIPLQSYNCGGEAANYGDAVTAVRNALATWMNLVQ